MVVLVVLAIAAGLLVASLEQDPRRVAMGEARRLAGALEHGAALAQWTGQTLGVSATGRSYRFWQRGPDAGWTTLAGNDVLAAHALPEGLDVAVTTYAGAPVATDVIVPLRPSGRNEPYTLVITHRGGLATLDSDPLNRVTIHADGTSNR
jgi:hypothetical protein